MSRAKTCTTDPTRSARTQQPTSTREHHTREPRQTKHNSNARSIHSRPRIGLNHGRVNGPHEVRCSPRTQQHINETIGTNQSNARYRGTGDSQSRRTRPNNAQPGYHQGTNGQNITKAPTTRTSTTRQATKPRPMRQHTIITSTRERRTPKPATPTRCTGGEGIGITSLIRHTLPATSPVQPSDLRDSEPTSARLDFNGVDSSFTLPIVAPTLGSSSSSRCRPPHAIPSLSLSCSLSLSLSKFLVTLRPNEDVRSHAD